MKKWMIGLMCGLVGASMAMGQYVIDFEGDGETKGSYASGTVSLSGMNWDMTEALIGTQANDWKVGARSARLRGYGTSSMTMLEDLAGGIGTLSFSYRRYGTDGQVDWKAEYSTDGGTIWTQIGSDFTAPDTDDVQSFSEAVNVSGAVRVRIKRATETGTSNKRLNIDDITMTSGGPATFGVSFDQADAFTVEEGSSATITATAANGTEPYTYAWTSTLGGTYYNASAAVFSILATAPTGSFSATVEATDASPETVTNTITFSVVPLYAITITPPTNGTVTTTPATAAEAGAPVTVNATPDGGYAVDTITVTAADTSNVEVTGETFIMPAQAVTVTVTFKVFVASALYISEVADPGDNWQQGRFVELYNSSGASIDLAAGTWNLARQANAGAFGNIALTGTVAAGETYVIANSADFSTAYPSAPAGNPDQVSGTISGNGDDGYFLYSGGDNVSGVLEDAYGVIDQLGGDWDYENKRASRNTSVTAGNPTWTASEWTIESANVADMTPGVYPDGPAVFGVTFDKPDNFTVSFGASEAVTATAANGTEPYTYAWDSTLGATYYDASNGVFTILATAPVGSYSATVVATDNAAQSVTNTINFNVVLDIATLPVAESYSATMDWTTLPGWSGVAMSTYADGSMSFNASGDILTVQVDGTPGDLTFDVKGNGSTAGTTPMQYDVEESVDGVTWTRVVSLTDTDMSTSYSTLGPYTLLGTSRYIRWNYVNKYVYNVALNNVNITSGGPPVFRVDLDKTNGFEVQEGNSATITATAANGTPPYSYSWSSTLGGADYTDVDDVFTILATAPTGSYSATVVASDSSGTPQLVTNNVTFSVVGLPPGAPAVIITGDMSGTVGVPLSLNISITNEVANDWQLPLKDPDGADVFSADYTGFPPIWAFTPTMTGTYTLVATAVTGSGDYSNTVSLVISAGSGGDDVPIPTITFVAGTGFTFDIPDGSGLVRVEGAETTVTAQEFIWTTLTSPTDYEVVGTTVTIKSGAATQRLIRVWFN